MNDELEDAIHEAAGMMFAIAQNMAEGPKRDQVIKVADRLLRAAGLKAKPN